MEENVKENELTEAFVRAVRVITKHMTIVDGIVVAVDTTPGDQNQWTCTVQIGSGSAVVNMLNVPMSVMIGEQAGFLVVPNVNSDCLLCWRDGNLGRPQLLFVNSVNQVLMNLTQLKVSASQAQGGVQFNGGNKGGLPITPDLVTRLNKIEQDMNNLKNALSDWTPVPNDGGAALKTAAGSWYGQQLVQTQRSDIENQAITQ